MAELDFLNDLDRLSKQQGATTVQQGAISEEMFIGLANQRRQVLQTSKAISTANQQQANLVANRAQAVSSQVRKAQASPLHDFFSLFNGEMSTEELIEKQIGLTNQLKTIQGNELSQQQNTKLAVGDLTQQMTDVLTLQQLRTSSSQQIGNIISQQSELNKLQRTALENQLAGFSQAELQKMSKAGDARFPLGEINRQIRKNRVEELNIALKEQELREGKGIKSGKDVLDVTSTSQLTTILNQMESSGTDKMQLGGFPITRTMVQTKLTANRKSQQESGAVLEGLNNNVTNAMIQVQNLPDVASRVELSTLPIELQQQFAAASEVNNQYQNAIQNVSNSDKQPTPQEINSIGFLADRTLAVSQKTIDDAASFRASEFENKVANNAATQYFKTGKIVTPQGGQNVITEKMLSTSTSSIASNAGPVLGSVVGEFVQSYSDEFLGHFPQSESSKVKGKPKGDINVDTASFFDAFKTGKVKAEIPYKRTLESKLWADDVVDSVSLEQAKISVNRWMVNVEAKLGIETRGALDEALLTVGGELKPGILQGQLQSDPTLPASSLSALSERIALVEADLKSRKILSEDIDLQREFFSLYIDEESMLTAREMLNYPDVTAQSFLTATMGSQPFQQYVDQLRKIVSNVDQVIDTNQATAIVNKSKEEKNKEALELVPSFNLRGF